MSQHKKNPVVAGAAVARRQRKPIAASVGAIVDNPGNKYGEASDCNKKGYYHCHTVTKTNSS